MDFFFGEVKGPKPKQKRQNIKVTPDRSEGPLKHMHEVKDEEKPEDFETNEDQGVVSSCYS